ncbi:hypothetical protein FF38_11318 [Lucilia cuprina]|uniref:Uncharacterized protein n=1 Tax=Lucilia cuprina TaxID=7375 RepID=A0A0L0BVN0_LUCCU|nr:hypothetical protein FF38_11318 [Lucilia cuprina]
MKILYTLALIFAFVWLTVAAPRPNNGAVAHVVSSLDNSAEVNRQDEIDDSYKNSDVNTFGKSGSISGAESKDHSSSNESAASGVEVPAVDSNEEDSHEEAHDVNAHGKSGSIAGVESKDHSSSNESAASGVEASAVDSNAEDIYKEVQHYSNSDAFSGDESKANDQSNLDDSADGTAETKPRIHSCYCPYYSYYSYYV